MTQEFYYVHRNNGAPLGKLYNKFHNWRNSMRNGTDKILEPNQKKSKTNNLYTVPASDQDHLRALKFDNLTVQDELMHWKGCIATRLNSFNSSEAEGKPISSVWPSYKKPYGYMMVTCFIFVYHSHI